MYSEHIVAEFSGFYSSTGSFQCMRFQDFMSFMLLAQSPTIGQWFTETIDRILVGDRTYWNAFYSQRIPHFQKMIFIHLSKKFPLASGNQSKFAE